MTQNPDPNSMPPEPTGPGSMPPAQGTNFTTPGGYAGPEPDKDAKTFAMLAHLLGIIGFLGPLIIWLVKKDTSPFVDDQGKEALNFHLTLVIGWVIGAVTLFICIGIVILAAVGIVGIVFSIIGAMKANQGIAYRYPFAIRLIK